MATSWTDSSLGTSIKARAVHLTQLKTAIDTLRTNTKNTAVASPSVSASTSVKINKANIKNLQTACNALVAKFSGNCCQANCCQTQCACQSCQKCQSCQRNCNCTCDCGDDNCIIVGKVLTSEGYKDIRDIKIGDYILDQHENKSRVEGISIGLLGDRKAISINGAVFTEDHAFLKDDIVYTSNINKLKSLFNIHFKCDDGSVGKYTLPEIIYDISKSNINYNYIEYPSDTKTITLITENADWCVVNDILASCAKKL